MAYTLHKARRVWRTVHCASPFAGRVLLTAGTNIVLILLGLVTGMLAARLLGPQGRGELAAIQTFPNFIATVAMLGLPDALVYFSARESDCAGCYLGSAMALALLVSFFFMMAGYLAMPVFLSAQSPEVLAAARWYMILVPIRALVGMSLLPLRGRNDLVAWNILRVTPAIGWLAVLVLAWFLARSQPEFVAAGQLFVLAILFFPFVYTVTQRLPGPFWPSLNKWGQMLRYGLPSVLSGVPQMLNFRLDQMLMVALLPARMLGLYVVAVAWSGVVDPLLNALGVVFFPRVASQNNPARQNLIFAQGVRIGALLSVIMAVGAIALTPWVIPLLFGTDFSAAIPAALVLVVASAIAGFNHILEEGLRGFGYPTKVMWAEFGGLAMTAVSLLLLLGPLGIMGAALASLLSYSTVTFLLVMQACQLAGHSLSTLLCPTIGEIRLIWGRMQALKEVMVKA